MTLRRSILTAGVALGAGLALLTGSPAFAAGTAPSATPDGTAGSRASTPLPNGGLTVHDFHVLGPLDQNDHVSARDNGQSVEYAGRTGSSTTRSRPTRMRSSPAPPP